MGLSLVPATIVAMQGLRGSESGLGSGLLNTSRLVGGALGLAILSTIADSRTRGAVGVGAARALTDGFDLVLAVGAVMCLASAATAVGLLRTRRDAVTTEARSGEERAARAEIEEREPLAA